MTRPALRAAIALVTCLAGVSATSLWHAATRSPAPVLAPVPKQELSPAPPSNSAEWELLEIERQYDVAQTNLDADFFQRIEADSFILTTADGQTLTKAQDIAAMKTWEKNMIYRSDDLRVQLYGNVATVTGRTTAIPVDGRSGHGPQWRWIDLFVKQGGRWQIISTTELSGD